MGYLQLKICAKRWERFRHRRMPRTFTVFSVACSGMRKDRVEMGRYRADSIWEPESRDDNEMYGLFQERLGHRTHSRSESGWFGISGDTIQSKVPRGMPHGMPRVEDSHWRGKTIQPVREGGSCRGLGLRKELAIFVGQAIQSGDRQSSGSADISNTASKPPARIERMALRLSQFDFNIVHKPGSTYIADYYSRHPAKADVAEYIKDKKVEHYINHIVSNVLPRALPIHEVIEATRMDVEMQELLELLRYNCEAQRLPKKSWNSCSQHLVRRWYTNPTMDHHSNPINSRVCKTVGVQAQESDALLAQSKCRSWKLHEEIG